MSQAIKEILVPLMGEGITEVTLVRWLKDKGAYVKKDEALVQVSTDKVDTEIASPHSGYLIAQIGSAGQTLSVNAIMAAVSEDKDAQYTPPPETAAKTVSRSTATSTSPTAGAPLRNQAAPMAAPRSGDERVRATPLVRKMARELNLNLGAIAGRGFGGRITRLDISQFIDQIIEHSKLANKLGGGSSSETIFPRLETKTTDGIEYLDGAPVRREKMSKMRRLIAEHMVSSVRTSPHVTTTFEVDMHRVAAQRQELADKVMKEKGFKLSYTHMIAHATVRALKEHPIINCSLDGDDILWRDDINLGLAVAIEGGLIVPVIKRAQNMDLITFASAAQDIIVRARAKKLLPEDVQGGSFSITNPGLFGSLHSNPIINQPQLAILSVGAIIDRPVVREGNIVVRPMMQMGLTFDHRVIDGEGGAKFLATLKVLLETT